MKTFRFTALRDLVDAKPRLSDADGEALAKDVMDVMDAEGEDIVECATV